MADLYLGGINHAGDDYVQLKLIMSPWRPSSHSRCRDKGDFYGPGHGEKMKNFQLESTNYT